MTAEIAVLNKTAVALAADSAVTISAGSKEEKIFNSADKLFELSNVNPIGIMIYNATSFAEIPLQSLIREYRGSCPNFPNIEAVAEHFLSYLHEVGIAAPEEVKVRSIAEAIRPVLEEIERRYQVNVQERLRNIKDYSSIEELLNSSMDSALALLERVYSRKTAGKFVGGSIRITKRTTDILENQVSEMSVPVTDEQRKRIVNLLKKSLRTRNPSPSTGGIVIAGYGAGEIFPTLVSLEIDGFVCDKLKYRKMPTVDIDRAGPRAKVIPFAQKEMVERFLYGLDGDIQRNLRLFCTRNIGSIREAMLDSLEFEDDNAKDNWIKAIRAAETSFLDGLAEDGFNAIRSLSESEIETMVEFMPKPELAKMAEALVNLTSIKRQVSRGMETVGGPVDVAVISASEGFVWVKRKHYFPPELNTRYFERVRARIVPQQE